MPSPKTRKADATHRLEDMVTSGVALVDRAANQRTWLMTKSEDGMPEKTKKEDGPMVLPSAGRQKLIEGVSDALETLTGVTQALAESEVDDDVDMPDSLPRMIKDASAKLSKVASALLAEDEADDEDNDGESPTNKAESGQGGQMADRTEKESAEKMAGDKKKMMEPDDEKKKGAKKMDHGDDDKSKKMDHMHDDKKKKRKSYMTRGKRKQMKEALETAIGMLEEVDPEDPHHDVLQKSIGFYKDQISAPMSVEEHEEILAEHTEKVAKAAAEAAVAAITAKAGGNAEAISKALNELKSDVSTATKTTSETEDEKVEKAAPKPSRLDCDDFSAAVMANASR